MPTANKLAALSFCGPPVELPATMEEKSTLEWQSKSPASGQPYTLMAEKSTLEWQTKSPASGQQSASMAEKSTLKWQTKSPASGQPSAPMAQKSTPKWQMKSLALGQPSAPMAQESTPEWQMTSPASGQPPMNKKPTPEWQSTSPTLGQPSACVSGGSALRATPCHQQLRLNAYSHASMIPKLKWSHPPTIFSLDDETWPTNLMDIIRAIKSTPPRCPTQPNFTFDLTPTPPKTI